MKMKYFTQLALVVFLLLSLTTNAQRQCATMELVEQQLQANPVLQERMQEIEQRTLQYLQEGVELRSTITIPVVIHVVYNTQAQNISDAQIASQMTVLNDDFGTVYQDASNKYSQAAATSIQFSLAEVRRVRTSRKFFNLSDEMKSKRWGSPAAPSDQYLNIWVCALNGYLGFAYLPGTADPSIDGVVIAYDAFGTTGTARFPYDGGRTATHEVGHWLNLYHTFQGGCAGYTANDCATAGDRVCDTPPVSSPNYECIEIDNCGGDTEKDMVENYMDYTDDACMFLFTAGQVARMEATFLPGGGRETFAGGTPPPPPPPGDCSAPVNLSASPNGTQGPWYKYTLSWDEVSGATYEWRIPETNGGGTVSSTSVDIKVRAGDYTFEVRANCNGTFSDWSTASFSTNPAARQAARLQEFTTIFPNPARDRILVQFQELDKVTGSIADLGTPDTYIVRLHDLTGRLLRNQVTDAGAGTLELNVGDLAPGLYFLRISDRNGELMSSHKVVVQP